MLMKKEQESDWEGNRIQTMRPGGGFDRVTLNKEHKDENRFTKYPVQIHGAIL